MKNKILKVLIAGAAFAGTTGLAHANSPMRTGSITSQPIGHYEFCQSYPAECGRTAGAGKVTLTRALWSRVIEINDTVNVMVQPRTDMEMWGREEYWSYPGRQGDCEDYVLEKRRLLMKAGVPASALLVTVVLQPNGDGHAVLTLSTDLGDFILDNLEPRVLAWDKTEYRYLKRQSSKNAGVWVSINDSRARTVGSIRR
ncbi:transglutaminase-like cysteine peptidase [Zhengella sp. ZM62]|uniref:transglutaminase-like cysteine peptidase n=1 Tax=Zhengella sedimenti TaxID=3390035 RepID=UPI003976A2C3